MKYMGKGNIAEVFLLESDEKNGSVLCKFSGDLVKKVKSALIKFAEPKKVRTQEVRCKKYRWTEREERKWTDFYNMIFSLEIFKLTRWGILAKRQIAG